MDIRGKDRSAFLPFLLGLGLAVLYFPFPSDKAHARTFTFGEWEGESLYDHAGKFAGCGMYKTYSNGVALSISITAAEDLEFYLTNFGWNYTVGKTFTVEFNLDDGENRRARAIAYAPEILGLVVGSARYELRHLQGARVLTMSVSGNDLQFDLAGVPMALDKLTECFTSAQKARAVGASDETAEDLPLAVIGFISEEDISVVKAVPPLIDRLFDPDVVWKSKHGFGLADIVPHPMRVRKAGGKVAPIPGEASCLDGYRRYTSSRKFGPKNISVTVVRTECLRNEYTDKPLSIVFAYFPSETGNLIRISHVSHNSADAVAAERRFFDAADAMWKFLFGHRN